MSKNVCMISSINNNIKKEQGYALRVNVSYCVNTFYTFGSHIPSFPFPCHWPSIRCDATEIFTKLFSLFFFWRRDELFRERKVLHIHSCFCRCLLAFGEEKSLLSDANALGHKSKRWLNGKECAWQNVYEKIFLFFSSYDLVWHIHVRSIWNW